MTLSRTELCGMADPRSWERGVTYFEEDRVHGVVRDGTTVVASVEGQQMYRASGSRCKRGICSRTAAA